MLKFSSEPSSVQSWPLIAHRSESVVGNEATHGINQWVAQMLDIINASDERSLAVMYILLEPSSGEASLPNVLYCFSNTKPSDRSDSI